LEHGTGSAYSYTIGVIRIFLADQWTSASVAGIARGGNGGSGVTGSPITDGYFLAGVELDRRDSARNPEGGFHLIAESRRGTKTFTPDTVEVHFARTRWELGGDGYRRFGRRWLGVLRGHFEFLDTPEDSVARWDQVEVGGASSLRGYREDQFLTLGTVILQAVASAPGRTRLGPLRLRRHGFIQEEVARSGICSTDSFSGSAWGFASQGPGSLAWNTESPRERAPWTGVCISVSTPCSDPDPARSPAPEPAV
jgi:hypothetical protein